MEQSFLCFLIARPSVDSRATQTPGPTREEGSVSELELLRRDFTLVHNPDTYNKFTVVPVVRLWEYSVE